MTPPIGLWVAIVKPGFAYWPSPLCFLEPEEIIFGGLSANFGRFVCASRIYVNDANFGEQKPGLKHNVLTGSKCF